jgi:F420-non-reducing hydrogenase small subunit
VKMAKPKVAFYWCASCGGCEEAVVDLNEDILGVVEAVDIALWPVALDYKKKHVEQWQPGEVTVVFINGAVRTDEQLEWVRLLREKCPLVVAFGSCAHLGGIPGLSNSTTRQETIDRKYHQSPSVDNPDGIVPQEKYVHNGYELELPAFHEAVSKLDDVIEVDYYLPGCPPTPEMIAGAVTAILEGKLPEKGSVLAPDKSLCDQCPRKDSKPEKIEISEFRRLATSSADPEECFLAGGYVCMGPSTRSGCGELCIRGNMPCRGCFGPTSQTRDMGAKFLSAIGSLLAASEQEQCDRIASTLADPMGTFYRFSLPASILKQRMS